MGHTLDWGGIEPQGTYPRTSILNHCKRVQQEFLRSDISMRKLLQSARIGKNGQRPSKSANNHSGLEDLNVGILAGSKIR